MTLFLNKQSIDSILSKQISEMGGVLLSSEDLHINDYSVVMRFQAKFNENCGKTEMTKIIYFLSGKHVFYHPGFPRSFS